MKHANTLRDAGRDIFPGKAFGALLFDMDGTLLTSIKASERVWGKWAERFGLKAQDFLPKSHGMRVMEVIESLGLPGVDPECEARSIFEAELADVADITEIAGAGAFLATLSPDQWAVVTSAPRELALRRLSVAGIPIPSVLVTAEDVLLGKPNPASFLLAARRLKIAPEKCLVFEDAPAGIRAGEAAGCDVVVVTAAHHQQTLMGRPSIQDYSRVSIHDPPPGAPRSKD